jgi:BirA family biotin operon repressor/biotin-[acetyl-CoA-carboxylase] ligase
VTANSLDVEKILVSSEQGPIGKDVRYFPEVSSTNQVAAELSLNECRDGTVLLADYQAAGKGRRGRIWQAPRGTSVLMSVILLPPDFTALGDFVMLAALSASDAVETYSAMKTTIKWPNDVMISGRKICGILAESSSGGGRRRIVLGIGINANIDFSDEDALSVHASSLSRELGHPIDREKLIVHLFSALNLWYRCLLDEPDALFAAWSARLDCIGRPLIVADGSGVWSGIGVGVQRDGGLLIRGEGETLRTVYAADVSIRNAEDRIDH